MAAATALLGLYGGLGLGLLGAMSSEVSLERARSSTWGGYGGAVIGLLMGAATGDDRTTLGLGVSGAALGILITFAATRHLDDIPDDAVVGRTESLQTMQPTVLATTDRRGRAQLVMGLDVIRGTF